MGNTWCANHMCEPEIDRSGPKICIGDRSIAPISGKGPHKEDWRGRFRPDGPLEPEVGHTWRQEGAGMLVF